MQSSPKVLVLDYKKWFCGGGKRNVGRGLGEGDVALLNQEGYMCCLGQFHQQCGISNDKLLYCSLPEEFNSDFHTISSDGFVDSAVNINDNVLTTILEKVKKLKSLCKKYRKELVLKNFPKSITDNV